MNKRVPATLFLMALGLSALTTDLSDGQELRSGGTVIKLVKASQGTCIFTIYSGAETQTFSLKENEFSHGIKADKTGEGACRISTLAPTDEYLTKGLPEKEGASPFLWALAGLGLLAVLAYYGKKK